MKGGRRRKKIICLVTREERKQCLVRQAGEESSAQPPLLLDARAASGACYSSIFLHGFHLFFLGAVELWRGPPEMGM